MKCPICAEETVGEEVQRWGPEWAHKRCVKAYSLGGCDARAAVEANSVPDGWKLVPVEPTKEMLRVGDQKTWILPSRDCWMAMLSAAPAPAQQERKPMTDEMAASDYFGRSEDAANPKNRTFTNGSFECFLGGIRFAERHHGIKE